MNEKDANKIIQTYKGWATSNANNIQILANEIELIKRSGDEKIDYIKIEQNGGRKSAGSFLELTDTPSDYIDKAGYTLQVNATEDGIEFVPDGQEDVWVVADIPARDALPIGLLDDEVSDGDIVKVLDSDGNGTEATYVWDETTSSWVIITQAGKVTPQITTGLTAVPTAVSPTGFVDYHLYMDTSASDIDLSTLGAVAGVPDGGMIHFHNAGANSLLWLDTIIGRTYNVSTLGDIISLQWKADTAVWIIR